MNSTKKAVDEIIEDLKKIPDRIETVIGTKKITEEVSKILKREITRRISSGI